MFSENTLKKSLLADQETIVPPNFCNTLVTAYGHASVMSQWRCAYLMLLRR